MRHFSKALMGAFVAAAAVASTPASAGVSAPVAAPTSSFSQAGLHQFDQSGSFYDRDRRDRRYDRRYARDERLGRNSRVWRGNDGRYRCRKDNGTTGLLIGGAVGGLAGNEIAGRGDKLLGTVIGAGAGALLGREIDRSKYRCR